MISSTVLVQLLPSQCQMKNALGFCEVYSKGVIITMFPGIVLGITGFKMYIYFIKRK